MLLMLLGNVALFEQALWAMRQQRTLPVIDWFFLSAFAYIPNCNQIEWQNLCQYPDLVDTVHQINIYI